MFKPTHKKKSSINIIPMIDVIFFLLIFFMLFTSFRTTPTGIDLQLPKAVTVQEQDNQNLIIDITSDGQFYLSGDKVSLSEIKEIAKNQHKKNNNLTVIINADKGTEYRYIVSVMDNLRQNGIYRLALAAEKEE